MTHCDEVVLYGPDDPLFPATAIAVNSNLGFAASGSTRENWKSTEPVRKIVRIAFEAAGVPNYGPHAFRHMLARHVVKNCTSVAELVANSQNLWSHRCIDHIAELRPNQPCQATQTDYRKHV